MSNKVDDIIAQNNYRLTADKIVQLMAQIRENPSLSAKRWAWELMQNAKDVPNVFGRVSVEIELTRDNRLLFRHNGDPFAMENVTGLVQQVSSKDSQNQEGQTGKFGTGFICTHLLSDVIEVEGVLEYDGFRRFHLQLDRSGERSEDLLPRIQESLETLRKADVCFPVIKDYAPRRKECDFDTVFTYHLTTEEKVDAARAGLNDLLNTLPITLVGQPKIKRVHVINNQEGTDVTYECQSCRIDQNVMRSEVLIDQLHKHFFTYSSQEVALTIEYKLKSDGTIVLLERDDQQPVLYRDFPLIGSERFYFPFTLNGYNFHPTERRNGLLLNTADSSAACKNRNILNHAVAVALEFNQWLIAQGVADRHILAETRIPQPVEGYDDKVAKPWIENLQKTWRSHLLGQELVETSNGKALVQEVAIPFYAGCPSESENFYQLVLSSNLTKGRALPKLEHLGKWIEISGHEPSSWTMKLRYDLEDLLRDVAEKRNLQTLATTMCIGTEAATEWLNNLYRFLVEQKKDELFDKYPLIPNQEGQLLFARDLQSDYAEPIPDALKAIYDAAKTDPIETTMAREGMRHDIIEKLLNKYGLSEITADLNKLVKNGDEDTALKLLALLPPSEDALHAKRQVVYEFAAAYKNLTSAANSDVILPEKLWDQADKFWKGNILSKIESYPDIKNLSQEMFLTPRSQQEALNWLNSLMAFFREQKEGDLLVDRKIFPAQTGQLCHLAELRYDDGIEDVYKDINEQLEYGSWRGQLLSRSITGYEKHHPCKTSDIYDQLKSDYDKAREEVRFNIASQVMAIIPTDEDGLAINALHRLAQEATGNRLPLTRSTSRPEGFKWDFAVKFFIQHITGIISDASTLKGLRSKSVNLQELTDKELILWVDRVIEFVRSYKQKRHWDIITDGEHGNGIWLNQKGEFCRFQDVRTDNAIPEDVKDIALNPHVNIDYREKLFSKDSIYAHYLETEPMTLGEIGDALDEAVSSYDGDKQESEFASLVFGLSNLCKKYPELKGVMKKFENRRAALIVGSLGEGETMNLVARLVQSDTEIQQKVKDFLNGKTSEVILGVARDDGLGADEREDYNREAREKVRQKLEPEGYSFAQGTGQFSVVRGVSRQGVTCPLVVKSHRTEHPLRLNPEEWMALAEPHSMLWVYFGGDTVKCVNIKELLREQDNISFSFQTDNLADDERVAALMHFLRYFKRMRLDLDSLSPRMVGEKYGDYDFNRTTGNAISAGDEDSPVNL